MKLAMFLHYWLQMALAAVSVPFLRLFNLRFSKAWRGNWFVSHVHANMWADGYPTGYMKFFNRYI